MPPVLTGFQFLFSSVFCCVPGVLSQGTHTFHMWSSGLHRDAPGRATFHKDKDSWNEPRTPLCNTEEFALAEN